MLSAQQLPPVELAFLGYRKHTTTAVRSSSFSRFGIGVRPLNKNYRLRGRDLEALAAAHVLAHQLVVDPDHVVAGFLNAHTVLLAEVARGIFLFGPLHPADVVIVALPAKGTRIVGLLDLLLLIEDISLVHYGYCSKRGGYTGSGGRLH